MLRTGLMVVLAFSLSGAALAQPRKAPQFAPMLDRACLPVMRGGAVAGAVENAKPLAFALTAKNATMATVQRDENFAITFGPRSCNASLAYADAGFFPAVESELRAWLPRLGRYWAGRIETDGSGLRYRKYRAGGFTWALEEQVDEHSRRLNLMVGP
jgi:hypothetical protein